MARYGLVWLEIARADYDSVPAEVRERIGMRIEQLLENPGHPARTTTSSPTSATTYGETGVGLIVYAVVHERQRVIILRLV